MYVLIKPIIDQYSLVTNTLGQRAYSPLFVFKL